MIVVMKPHASDESIKAVIQAIQSYGLETHVSQGKQITIIGVLGDKTKLADANLEVFENVEKIVPVTESYKLSNIVFHPEPSTIPVGNIAFGPKKTVIIAGPCAVETEKQLLEIAHNVKKSGANMLRGGAYKPRTSPYSFQGLEEDGLRYMKTAKEETGLATICEVVSPDAIEAAVKYVDMIQIGARNMQNFFLLKEAGKSGLPVLLKRGLCATLDEWLNAAEYIMAEGNKNIVLCERGIRTYETSTRNTLDLSAVPALKSKSHLPIIVDPSHATGVRNYVSPLAKASIACGADGLMIEVHDNPAKALSDGPQSLTFSQFDQLCKELKPYVELSGRTLNGV